MSAHFRPYLYLVVLMISSIISVSRCCAQAKDSVYYKPGKLYYMAGLNIGGGSAGIHADLSLDITINKLILTAQYGEDEPLLFLGNNGKPDYSFTSFGMLAGRKIIGQPLSYVSISGGLSYNAIQTRTYVFNSTVPAGKYVYDNIHNAGIPLLLSYRNNAILRYISSIAAVGVNLNSTKTYFNIVLGLRFGYTRERRPKTKK